MPRRVPMEIYAEQHWAIYDPNGADTVAVFFDEADAEEYLRWRNEEDEP